MRTKSYPLPISRQINTNFRNYALYVLENRGIPSFYDGLTNVQRFIVLNSPSTFNKTISLVGSCISDGYHHGDKSLIGAINKLARPFGCSEQILLGDGFFGTPVNHEASAARYTSIKINPPVNEMVRKNNFLHKKNDEGGWEPLWIDLPIGLTNTIVGIAVGYKTTILPRSLKDVEKYLNGKLKEVKPSFIGFTGKITRYKGMDKSWLIEGVVKRDDSQKQIKVVELPPLMRYGAFLKKLDKILELYPNTRITNNSSTNVDITIAYTGRDTDGWKSCADAIEKSTKMLVTETPVFVKDGLVLEYNRIEDYLEDYRYRIAHLRVKRAEYYTQVCSDELEFNRAKKLYLEYMLEKKRTETDIEKFLDKWANVSNIKRRLESIYLKNLNAQELERTIKRIIELEADLKKNQQELTESSKILDSMIDPTIARGRKSAASNTDLFSDETEIDGIEVFGNSSSDDDDDTEDSDDNDY
jgi:topoisomerase-4 subunit A